MRTMSRHTEWLSLVEVSGPFLAVGVLEKIFPQGLDSIESTRRRRARSAYDEWRDAVEIDDPMLTDLHGEWIRLVLTEILEFEETVLFPNDEDEPEILYRSPEHTGSFVPDFNLRTGKGEKPLLFVSIQQPETNLESVKVGDGWPVSIVERMTLLCRSNGVRLGLVTNGERWVLVNAPIGSTSSLVSWYARLWFQEPITLKAFQSLLGVRRWFGPEEVTLPAILEESIQHHEEVTDTLGEQVRRAVEVLVQCLDKADQDRNRELLHDVTPSELYEAGLTVMMRLVFVLCAEERDLLLLGDPTYDQHYAIGTMRIQLAEEADRYGPEVLERRHDAWARLLSVFRAVYGGVDQEMLRMPAMGGSLFDPDRFPFLEGRQKGTHWQDTDAKPLPIDNRTVLLLLNALQVLEQRSGALLLSYKALNVEQIGHVYEGLLEHTVKRLPQVTLGLEGSQKAKNPNLGLSEMESARLDGEKAIVDLIKEATKRSASAIEKALKKDVDEETFGRVISVSGGDMELANRIRPFSHLLRKDAWGDYIVYHANSFAVTLGADRRETGTHYTPRSLTESIVETTLEPLVYVGPAEGKPREEWQLNPSAELLDLKICDPAMGSGAFLVQVCRYLSERLVEAWGKEMADGKFISVDGIALDEAGGMEPMPDSLDERLLIARRLVAEKCLYGVDLNPLAVELAKLSIWLITLAQGRPFGFLDHNLRSGDSLLGLHKLEQLTKFSLHPEKKLTISLFASNIEAAVKDALGLRKRLRKTPIRDIRDVQYMEHLDQQARQKLEHIEHIADAMIGEALASGGNYRTLEIAMKNLSTWAAAFIEGDNETGRKIIAEARNSLSMDLPAGKPPRKPFHWALEFPEVFEHGGFDGIVGNPPFRGGLMITRDFGLYYTKYLKGMAINAGTTTDLCAYFFRRISMLICNKGSFGLLSTNSICEGDSKKTALEPLFKSPGAVFHAIKSLPWPGKAVLYVSLINFYKGKWRGVYKLDGTLVPFINDSLTAIKTSSSPKKIANFAPAYLGTTVYGKGFFLSHEETKELLEENSENSSFIKKYLSAEDIIGSDRPGPSRFVLNLQGLSINEIKEIGSLYDFAKGRIYDDRQKSGTKSRREKWWLYASPATDLYKQISKLDFVFTTCHTSKFIVFEKMPTDIVFSNTVIVFASDSYGFFGLLQSNFHQSWVQRYSSTLKTDQRYAISDCYATFPTSCSIQMLEKIGQDYYKYRKGLMEKFREGLTSIYNRFHELSESSNDINMFRKLHVKLNNAVATAYGWDDLDLAHGFHETKQGIRFTISEEARREVLQRLLKLNHECYEAEVAQGLHDKKKKTKSKVNRRKERQNRNSVNLQQKMFGENTK